MGKLRARRGVLVSFEALRHIHDECAPYGWVSRDRFPPPADGTLVAFLRALPLPLYAGGGKTRLQLPDMGVRATDVKFHFTEALEDGRQYPEDLRSAPEDVVYGLLEGSAPETWNVEMVGKEGNEEERVLVSKRDLHTGEVILPFINGELLRWDELPPEFESAEKKRMYMNCWTDSLWRGHAETLGNANVGHGLVTIFGMPVVVCFALRPIQGGERIRMKVLHARNTIMTFLVCGMDIPGRGIESSVVVDSYGKVVSLSSYYRSEFRRFESNKDFKKLADMLSYYISDKKHPCLRTLLEHIRISEPNWDKTRTPHLLFSTFRNLSAALEWGIFCAQDDIESSMMQLSTNWLISSRQWFLEWWRPEFLNEVYNMLQSANRS